MARLLLPTALLVAIGTAFLVARYRFSTLSSFSSDGQFLDGEQFLDPQGLPVVIVEAPPAESEFYRDTRTSPTHRRSPDAPDAARSSPHPADSFAPRSGPAVVTAGAAFPTSAFPTSAFPTPPTSPPPSHSARTPTARHPPKLSATPVPRDDQAPLPPTSPPMHPFLAQLHSSGALLRDRYSMQHLLPPDLGRPLAYMKLVEDGAAPSGEQESLLDEVGSVSAADDSTTVLLRSGVRVEYFPQPELFRTTEQNRGFLPVYPIWFAMSVADMVLPDPVRMSATDNPRLAQQLRANKTRLAQQLRANKTRLFAQLIPGKKQTYSFRTEASYYQGYEQAIFGLTMCKASV